MGAGQWNKPGAPVVCRCKEADKERPGTKPPWAAGILIGLLVAAFVACSTEPQPTATPAPDTDKFDLPDVLIQFDYEPTFSTTERFAPFGRVPPFTLLEDGTLIYLDGGGRYDEQRVMEVRLSGDDVEALVQQVLDLGFERLENYSEQCQNLDDGTGMWPRRRFLYSPESPSPLRRASR